MNGHGNPVELLARYANGDESLDPLRELQRLAARSGPRLLSKYEMPDTEDKPRLGERQNSQSV